MRAQVVWWGTLTGGLLAQTALLPLVFPDAWRPDITRSLVLWVALTGIPRGGPFLAFAAGTALDLAAGASWGFGAFSRLVLYGAARVFRGVFFDTYPALLIPFALLGVVADTAAAGLLAHIFFVTAPGPQTLLSIAWRQAALEMFCLPAVFLLLEVASGRRAGREMTA